jgi:hypothetical protein
MDNLIVVLILFIWIVSLPLGLDDTEEDGQLPRLSKGFDGKLQVALFPSRTGVVREDDTYGTATHRKRYWSVSLSEAEIKGKLVDSLVVMEGLQINAIGEVWYLFSLVTLQATILTEGNMTNLGIVSNIPVVIGFLEGYLTGDLVRKRAFDLKNIIHQAYGPANLEKVTSLSSIHSDTRY